MRSYRVRVVIFCNRYRRDLFEPQAESQQGDKTVTSDLVRRAAYLFIILLLPVPAQAQAPDKFTASLTADERKALKATQEDWAKHATSPDHQSFEANALVLSQIVLGRFGYGTKFTGVIDEQTKEAIKSYQGNGGIAQTGVLDPETFFSLNRDNELADKNLPALASFHFHWNDNFVTAEGSWDGLNNSEVFFESSEIECTRSPYICVEADATVMSLFLVGPLQAKQTTFTIIHWDEYEIVAEDSTPQCERDRLVLNQQEKSATITSIPTYKGDSCKKELGPPETVTYRLIDGQKLSIQRWTANQKRRQSLYLISPNARNILDKK